MSAYFERIIREQHLQHKEQKSKSIELPQRGHQDLNTAAQRQDLEALRDPAIEQD